MILRLLVWAEDEGSSARCCEEIDTLSMDSVPCEDSHSGFPAFSVSLPFFVRLIPCRNMMNC